MPDNINLDVSQVLSLFSSLKLSDPNTADRVLDVLRLILNRETLSPGDVTEALLPLIARLDTMTLSQQQLLKQSGDLTMGFTEVKAAIEANTAQAAKSQIEIRAKMDELIAKNGDVDTAVAAALAAQATKNAEDQATALADIQTAIDAQKTAIQALDDVVPDAAPEP